MHTDDSLVHLAGSPPTRSLCGSTVQATSKRTSFRIAGCSACLVAAREALHTVARDGDHSWINLARMRPAAS